MHCTRCSLLTLQSAACHHSVLYTSLIEAIDFMILAMHAADWRRLSRGRNTGILLAHGWLSVWFCLFDHWCPSDLREFHVWCKDVDIVMYLLLLFGSSIFVVVFFVCSVLPACAEFEISFLLFRLSVTPHDSSSIGWIHFVRSLSYFNSEY